jgi:fluoride exporter
MHTPPSNGTRSVAAAMIWSVALGSAAGGVARYLVGGFVQRSAPGPFPYGTLLINVAGSLLLGFILRYALLTPGLSAEWRAGLTIGLCGGFTTFSTFSVEVVSLLESGDYKRAAVYIVVSVALSIAAVVAGFALAQSLVGSPPSSD